MRQPVSAALVEPRAPGAPPTGRADVAVFAAVVALVGVGVTFEPDVVWRPFAAAFGVLLATSLLWRRSHPLLAVMGAFSAQAAADVVSYAVVDGSIIVLGTLVTGLVLCYSLGRWGSGREVTAGLIVAIVAHIVSEATNDATNLPPSRRTRCFGCSPRRSVRPSDSERAW